MRKFLFLILLTINFAFGQTYKAGNYLFAPYSPVLNIPIDNRFVVADILDLDIITKYPGLLTYVTSTNKMYIYNGTAWTEFVGSGSSSGSSGNYIPLTGSDNISGNLLFSGERMIGNTTNNITFGDNMVISSGTHKINLTTGFNINNTGYDFDLKNNGFTYRTTNNSINIAENVITSNLGTTQSSKLSLIPNSGYSFVKLPKTSTSNNNTYRYLTSSINSIFADENGNINIDAITTSGTTTTTPIVGTLHISNGSILNTLNPDNINLSNGSNITKYGIGTITYSGILSLPTGTGTLIRTVNNVAADLAGNVTLTLDNIATNVARLNTVQTFSAAQTFTNIIVPTATSDNQAINLGQLNTRLNNTFQTAETSINLTLAAGHNNRQILVNGTDLTVTVPSDLANNYNVSLDYAKSGYLVVPSTASGDFDENTYVASNGQLTLPIPKNGMIYIYKTSNGTLRIKGDIL